MAASLGMEGGLTTRHWQVIRFIRDHMNRHDVCPLIYETCRACGLNSYALSRLFPAGYLRGACRLAGITYADR